MVRFGNRNESVVSPRPSWVGTSVLIGGAAISAIQVGGSSVQSVSGAAIVCGIALVGLLIIEMRRNIMNILRADLLMLIALYALLYAEFLLPHEGIATQVYSSVQGTVNAIGLGMASIAVGRHTVFGGYGIAALTSNDVSARSLFKVVVSVALLGFSQMLWSVDLNPIAMFDEMMGPRFSQSWARGQLGGWGSLFYEINLLLFLVPPLSGALFAQDGKAGIGRQKRVVVALLLVACLFYGFTTGTRYVLAVYVASFCIAYLFARPRRSWRSSVVIMCVAALLLGVVNSQMLGFRNVGLKNYLEESGGVGSFGAEQSEGLFVDNNFYTLSLIVDTFPDRAGYLGLEVPMWALAKIVPRAIWSAKPTGLSIPIEGIRISDDGGTTWAVTFVGEAYMAAGLTGVLLAGVGFGALATWWSRLLIVRPTVFQKLVYASGLFGLLIAMRSLFWVTTGLLPALVLVAYSAWKRRADSKR